MSPRIPSLSHDEVVQSRRLVLAASGVVSLGWLSGCAVQSPPVTPREAPVAAQDLRAAQQAVVNLPPKKPALKRKIALGRITNETSYGQSLLRDRSGDPLGKQVTDLLSKALSESGSFLVFERPDIGKVEAESRLTDGRLNLIGVDALIIGSLTEFGRKTLGATGFVSASKRQVAFAKIDVRVVDTNTGQILFATSGAGEASTETASTFGFGSQAGYDGTLNDAAIRQAVSEAVSRLAVDFSSRPWQTFILKAEGDRLFLSGGKSQGLQAGQILQVLTQGEKIKSPQTGAMVTLPGRTLAQVQIEALFGDNELNEGSVARIRSGSLESMRVEQLVVRVQE